MGGRIVFTELMIFLMIFMFASVFGGALLFPLIVKTMGIDDLQGFINTLSLDASSSDRFKAKIIMILNQVFTFLIPSLIFLAWIHKRKAVSFIQANRFPNMQLLILGCIFMVVSFPLAQVLLKLNQFIVLPENLSNLESQANNTAQVLLVMNNPSEFLLTLLTIAVVPAICEEIFFRGILQNYLTEHKAHMGILIAAFIFAAIHRQWESFLPRFFLGIALGYLFFYSKSLWLPILAHFVLNGMQIVPVYFSEIDLADKVGKLSIPLVVASLILSTAIGFLIYRNITQNTSKPFLQNE